VSAAPRLPLKRRAGVHVAAVVPAYNVEEELGSVLRAMPPIFTTIVVVDDASHDHTGELADRYAQLDPRVLVVHHQNNRGVGGAMVTGFRTAVDAGADVIVKIDGDGQMPLWLVPHLLDPLVRGNADYSKGNRFRDFAAIRAMPMARRVGNVILSFLAKAATGYWRCFDPTNGFLAIRADVLSQLPLHKIDETYFFEISMLSHLYLIGAVVKEVPMPARYAGETSSLSIGRVMRQFPRKLLWSLARRITLRNFIYDFNLESLDLAAGNDLLSDATPRYAVQLMVTDARERTYIENYIAEAGRAIPYERLFVVPSGNPESPRLGVLFGTFDERAGAAAALAALPESVKQFRPYVRSMDTIREDARRAERP